MPEVVLRQCLRRPTRWDQLIECLAMGAIHYVNTAKSFRICYYAIPRLRNATISRTDMGRVDEINTFNRS